MESRAKIKSDSLEATIRKTPMVPMPAIGAPFGFGPSATEGEAQRLGLQLAQRPNGRKLASIEQAEMIVRSYLERNTRA